MTVMQNFTSNWTASELALLIIVSGMVLEGIIEAIRRKL